MTAIEIRPAQEWEDYIQCEKVQRKIWEAPQGGDVVPAALLKTAHKNGGLVLCAFDGPDMVGFVFSFLGAEGTGTGRRIKHCSHMLGVLLEYRTRGLAVELKKGQREALLQQGLELATWTYDPLQAINARLNLSRLGAVARRYLREAYGEMADVLNAGVASDRFEVEWWLASPRVKARVDSLYTAAREPEAQPVYEIAFDAQGLPRITGEAQLHEAVCAVEIPRDFNALKASDLGLAREWRERTRGTLERAFASGYSAVEVKDFADDAGRLRVQYILKRNENSI